jgi:hypothetical protein
LPRYAPIMTTTSFNGDVGYAPPWAGTSVGVVQAVQSAADIVRQLAHDATAILHADGRPTPTQ